MVLSNFVQIEKNMKSQYEKITEDLKSFLKKSAKK